MVAPTHSTRAWIQDMDLAAERVGQNGIVDVVTQTVQGALRHALEAFISSVPGQRGDVPCRDIRGNVLRHFLSTDEEAALRDMVEGQLVQEEGGAENVYARRYKEGGSEGVSGRQPEPGSTPDLGEILPEWAAQVDLGT